MADNYEAINQYLQSLFGIEPLPVEEEHQLAKQIQAGDHRALEKLVKHNLRFVVFLLKNTTAWQHGTMPVEDLINIGNEQLVKAAKRWNPTNNARFATYARSFILKGTRRELDNTSHMIRLPVNVSEQIKKMNYNDRALSQVLGRKPKASEVATMMGVHESVVLKLQSYIGREPVSLESIDEERYVEDDDGN
ncbi:sporulation sigma factor SigF [uncultured Caudovirales phage]|uniref:Sporulation sigma factor SigF n=1 Tax=uncultured Caudovirales phage TaxID=2100421 RepID=A0A6J5L769_9CAUD|nr:sporulation sigma factor SigF [uncultured Caudovirales phage]